MTARKKRGRPPLLWQAEDGKAFLSAVFQIQSECHPIKTVDAINRALKKPEFAHLKKYPLRYLEKKYQEISRSNPYSDLHKQFRRAEYLRTVHKNKANYRNSF
jgi:hypothetical protein